MSVKAILTDQQRSYTKAEEDTLLAQKQDILTFDNEPTLGSSNPVKSSGIKTSIDNVINGVTPVALAENLTSDSAQSSADTFIERTTGGTASLSDGDGWIQIVRGSHIHTGYAPSDVDMTVTPVLHTLTGTIDQETFFAAVSDDSGTKTFTYTTNWDYNPVTYGITLTGTPLAGDQIVVTYDTNSAVSMTVNSPGEDITATIDEEDFLAQVSGSSGTVTFTYTDSWDTNPATYGITVTGTPAEDDSISVTYLITHIASMTVLPIYHSISVEIDEATFLSEMSNASGYMEFTYTTNWDYNPVTYGITVTGSPISGDKIRVDYIKETRGTITQSNPQSFKSSGWNLYNHTNGYARVLKYSETYGFGIAGTYTSLAFSSTISGTQTAVTVTNDRFTIPEDGYIFVTGGNDTDTQIWMTWSDWTSQANGGTWEAYTESTVDFSSVMSSYFPYGLLEVGTYQDEINFSSGIATNKVARIDYSLANLANVKAMGVDYEYDENYIYYGLSTPVTNSISIDNSVDAYDHGMEWFTETALAVYAQTIYGINLKNKLERDVLTISQQDLTNSDIAQVKENLKMSYICNENLLRNWYFVGGGTGRGVFPVNQRGQTSYGPGYGYGIDGWYHIFGSGGVNVTLNQTGLSFGPVNSSNHGLLRQYFDNGTFSIIAGKQITVSFLLSNGSFFTGTAIIDAVEKTLIDTTYASNYLRARINTTNKYFELDRYGDPIEIVAIKVEPGNQQTLCHQKNGVQVLNEIPDYEEELLKCQTSTADTSDDYANKVIATNISNPNLLRNWYFIGGGTGYNVFPVNNRRLTDSSSGLFIDGWVRGNAYGSVINLLSNGIQISSDTSQWQDIHQLLDINPLDISGKVLTLSALFSDGTLLSKTAKVTPGSGNNNHMSITEGNTSIFLYGNSTALSAYARSTTTTTGTNSFIVQAMKLELGSEQTLARKTTDGSWQIIEIPSYSEEELKCQSSRINTADLYANQDIGQITVSCTSVGSSSLTYYNPLIRRTHVVLDSTFSNPAAQSGNITVNTQDGYLTFSNNFFSGATTNITLVLGTSGPVLTTTTTAPS